MQAEGILLNNSVVMPLLGFGTWKIAEGAPIIEATNFALEAGYRLFDTAKLYENEKGLGNALLSSGFDRDEYFVTSKVWNSDQGYEATLKAFDVSLKNTGLDYLDAYLIHWPMPRTQKFIETWKALEKLYEEGLVRVIGVANFHIHHLDLLLQAANIVPMLNQVECHLGLQQQALLSYCQKHQIVMQAWRPLAKAADVLVNHPIVTDIARKHRKTPAQLMLAYLVERGIGVIPKSTHPERIKENADIFDFQITSTQMAELATLEGSIPRLGVDPEDFHDTVYVARN